MESRQDVAKPKRPPPLVVGLTGGVASGKSAVAAVWRRLGASLFDADRAGHQALADAEVQAALQRRFGEGICQDGEIDRAALAKLVFGDSPQANANRAALESIVHPHITRQFLDWIEQAKQDDDASVVVVDAPLLVEVGWHDRCDQVVFVDAPEADRQARAAARGWSEEQFRAREAAQAPIEKKRVAADLVLPNHGSLDELRKAAAELWITMASAAARR